MVNERWQFGGGEDAAETLNPVIDFDTEPLFLPPPPLIPTPSPDADRSWSFYGVSADDDRHDVPDDEARRLMGIGEPFGTFNVPDWHELPPTLPQ